MAVAINSALVPSNVTGVPNINSFTDCTILDVPISVSPTGTATASISSITQTGSLAGAVDTQTANLSGIVVVDEEENPMVPPYEIVAMVLISGDLGAGPNTWEVTMEQPTS